MVGQVVDADSLAPLRGVRIAVGTGYVATTDLQGAFSLVGLPAGAHTLLASREEYDPVAQEVAVAEGQPTPVSVEMDTTRDDWLKSGTSYRWQVEVVHPDGTSTSGPEWTFSTESATAARKVPVTEPVDEASARKVALAFLGGRPQAGRVLGAVEGVTDGDGSTLAWLFHLQPKGHILVPATRANTPPVLSYSFENSLLAWAPGTETLLGLARLDLQGRLAAAQAGSRFPQEVARRNEARWSSALAGHSQAEDTSPKVYGPLCPSPTWNQSSPYNELCPVDPKYPPERSITGCVATAYSQIFNRWLAPTAFTFTAQDSYTTRTRGIAIDATTANFSGINYNGGQPDDATVARISYATGVLSRMDYTCENSGAYTFNVGKALARRWGYGATSDARFDPDEAFDATAMIGNLTASPGKPVVMAIRKYDFAAGQSRRGHAIVVDGYDTATTTFHLNMGWGGSKDAWYSLPSGLPSGYNYVAGYVYDLVPAAQEARRVLAAPIPAGEYPENGETGVPTDESLDWDECDNAAYYRCYLWEAGQAKPVTPTFPNLPFAAAGPEWE